MDIFSKITSPKDKIIISALAVFVLSVFAGVIFILTQDLEWGSSAEIYKVVYSLIILAVAVVILIDNLRKMSSNNKKAKILGFCSLIFGPICLVLGLLLLWEVIPAYNKTPDPDCGFYDITYYSNYCYDYTPTIFAKLIPTMIYIEALFFLGSDVFSIKKNGQKIIDPMKIVAVIFLVLGVIIGICNINIDYDYAALIKMNIIFVITMVSFVGTTVATFLVSKSSTPAPEKVKPITPAKPEPLYPDKKPDYDQELSAKYNGQPSTEQVIEENLTYTQVDYNETEGDQNNAV